MKRIVYIVLIVVLAVGCKKTPIEKPMSALPDLRGSGMLNDEPFNVAAGVDNFYMEAGFDRNDEGVNEFTGEFKKDNGDLTSLKIVIQDNQRRLPVEPVAVDVAVSEGFYDFKTDAVSIDPYTLQFYSLAYAAGDYNYNWSLNGSAISGDPTAAFPIISFGSYTDFDLQVEVSDGAGCIDTLTQAINEAAAPTPLSPYFKVPFRKEHLGNGGVRFYYPEDYEATNQIKWDVIEDGQNYTVNDAPEYIHYFSGDGPYRVTMNVIMGNGYAFKYVENVAPYENTCAASVQFEAVPVDPEAVAVSQVRVEYTNDNGVVYSSYHPDVEEDPDRAFEVLSITDYDATSTGLETRKVNVLFSCTLYNQQDPNDTMRIDDFTGSIAVSFPQ